MYKKSHSLLKPQLAPELQGPFPRKKARTLYTKTHNRPKRSPSSSSKHSKESSSSSSNNLSDEEIRFNQINLHPYERRASIHIEDQEALVHKLLHARHEVSLPLAEASRAEGEENWIPDTAEIPSNIFNMVRAASTTIGTVKIYDIAAGNFYTSTKESVVEEYRRGGNYIVECFNYTRQDVIYFAKALKINAVLCWELLTKYTPDKHQKFGQKCSLYVINTATDIEALKAKSISLKIVRIPRLLLIFTPNELDLEEIIPPEVKVITPDILIYLLLRYAINQTEETVNELKILVQRIYNESFNPENVERRSHFVENIGKLSSLLLNLKEHVEYKKEFLNEMLEDDTLDPLFRYLIRHLRGKVRHASMSIEDLELLLNASKKQFAALIDHQIVQDNRKVDSYFQLILVISVLTGVADVTSAYMGMNVKLPGGDAGNFVPLSVILAITLVIIVLFYIALKCSRFV